MITIKCDNYRCEHLIRHLRIHSGEKPYKCSFLNCNKRFSRRDGLKRHEQLHYQRQRQPNKNGILKKKKGRDIISERKKKDGFTLNTYSNQNQTIPYSFNSTFQNSINIVTTYKLNRENNVKNIYQSPIINKTSDYNRFNYHPVNEYNDLKNDLNNNNNNSNINNFINNNKMLNIKDEVYNDNDYLKSYSLSCNTGSPINHSSISEPLNNCYENNNERYSLDYSLNKTMNSYKDNINSNCSNSNPVNIKSYSYHNNICNNSNNHNNNINEYNNYNYNRNCNKINENYNHYYSNTSKNDFTLKKYSDNKNNNIQNDNYFENNSYHSKEYFLTNTNNNIQNYSDGDLIIDKNIYDRKMESKELKSFTNDFNFLTNGHYENGNSQYQNKNITYLQSDDNNKMTCNYNSSGINNNTSYSYRNDNYDNPNPITYQDRKEKWNNNYINKDNPIHNESPTSKESYTYDYYYEKKIKQNEIYTATTATTATTFSSNDKSNNSNDSNRTLFDYSNNKKEFLNYKCNDNNNNNEKESWSNQNTLTSHNNFESIKDEINLNNNYSLNSYHIQNEIISNEKERKLDDLKITKSEINKKILDKIKKNDSLLPSEIYNNHDETRVNNIDNDNENNKE
eukprot:jgi/Orpsp1_1/1186422/evm.model.d7180000050464.1